MKRYDTKRKWTKLYHHRYDTWCIGPYCPSLLINIRI